MRPTQEQERDYLRALAALAARSREDSEKMREIARRQLERARAQHQKFLKRARLYSD